VATFSDQWRAQNSGREVLLLCDNLGAHQVPETIEFALGKGLFLFSLPPNSSHIHERLDEAHFASLNATTDRSMDQTIYDSMTMSTPVRDAPLLAAYRAKVTAFTPKTKSGAFRRCGLWPFDAETMTLRTREALGYVDSDGTMAGVAKAEERLFAQEDFQRAASSRRGVVAGTVVVSRGVLHSLEALNDQHREREKNRP